MALSKVQGSLGFTLRKEDSSVLGHYVRALVREPAISAGRIRPGDKIVAVSSLGGPLPIDPLFQCARPLDEGRRVAGERRRHLPHDPRGGGAVPAAGRRHRAAEAVPRRGPDPRVGVVPHGGTQGLPPQNPKVKDFRCVEMTVVWSRHEPMLTCARRLFRKEALDMLSDLAVRRMAPRPGESSTLGRPRRSAGRGTATSSSASSSHLQQQRARTQSFGKATARDCEIDLLFGIQH